MFSGIFRFIIPLVQMRRDNDQSLSLLVNAEFHILKQVAQFLTPLRAYRPHPIAVAPIPQKEGKGQCCTVCREGACCCKFLDTPDRHTPSIFHPDIDLNRSKFIRSRTGNDSTHAILPSLAQCLERQLERCSFLLHNYMIISSYNSVVLASELTSGEDFPVTDKTDYRIKLTVPESELLQKPVQDIFPMRILPEQADIDT